jgi:hypothetical protein
VDVDEPGEPVDEQRAMTLVDLHRELELGRPFRSSSRVGQERQIALPRITILHFRDDKMVERFSQADILGLLVQLGAVPAPA